VAAGQSDGIKANGKPETAGKPEAEGNGKPAADNHSNNGKGKK
jgi:hypothetical protein